MKMVQMNKLLRNNLTIKLNKPNKIKLKTRKKSLMIAPQPIVVVIAHQLQHQLKRKPQLLRKRKNKKQIMKIMMKKNHKSNTNQLKISLKSQKKRKVKKINNNSQNNLLPRLNRNQLIKKLWRLQV